MLFELIEISTRVTFKRAFLSKNSQFSTNTSSGVFKGGGRWCDRPFGPTVNFFG